jgi:hypothetical protein
MDRLPFDRHRLYFDRRGIGDDEGEGEGWTPAIHRDRGGLPEPRRGSLSGDDGRESNQDEEQEGQEDTVHRRLLSLR